MTEIEMNIQKSLDEIEKQHDVKILLAVESGSRSWGFASPDSDYDVRIIYLQKPEEYLRIDETKDYIDWMLDEVYDINGWDIKKALMAFGKGNPNVFEWMNSPIIYRKSDIWDDIAVKAKEYFSEKAAIYHYYGTANSTYQKYLMEENVKYKKYFYALRPLLCCRWVERYHEAPPMRFDELLNLFDGTEIDLSEELLSEINRLVDIKKETKESDLNEHIPVIITFIKTELERQKAIADSLTDDRKSDYTELNELFRSLITRKM